MSALHNNIKLFIFILFLPFFIPVSSYAGTGELYLGNQLIPIETQIFELQSKCAELDDIEDSKAHLCWEKLEKLKNSRKKLYVMCQSNPLDRRCDLILERKKDYVDEFRIMCLQKPYMPKCIAERERKRADSKMLNKFCAKNPTADRCQPSTQIPQNFRDRFEYCRRYPAEKFCRGFNKQIKENERRKQELMKQEEKSIQSF